MAGLTPEGFIPKTLDELVAELEAAIKGEFGESFDVSPQSAAGQLIGVMAERYADLWALGQDLYAAATADGATDDALDDVCALTGTVREPASLSTVTVTATGTPGTLLGLGRLVSVVVTEVQFFTLTNATIAAVSAWTGLTLYATGDRVTNGSRVYHCISGGISAVSGGPSGTGAVIADAGAVWRYLGEGTGAVDVACAATETGPKVAASGTLTVIDTPVSGWQSVINLLDAEPGSDIETDASLRARREEELAAGGTSTLEAIRSALLDVDDVESVTVFENVTDTTDGDGVPPHAVEAVVYGGDDAEIAAALFANVAAGIATHGGESEVVTDSQGVDHTIEFSRPDEIEIWVIANLTVNTDPELGPVYPTDGDDQVEAAFTAYGNSQATGKNAVASALVARAFTIAGVLEAEVLIGLSDPPTLSATIPIDSRELATYDTSRIVVNSTPGVP